MTGREFVGSPFGGVDAAAAERLVKLAEECGEIVQAFGKVARFGFDTVGPGETRTHRELLQLEIADLIAAADIMARAGDLDRDAITAAVPIARKRALSHMCLQGRLK